MELFRLSDEQNVDFVLLARVVSMKRILKKSFFTLFFNVTKIIFSKCSKEFGGHLIVKTKNIVVIIKNSNWEFQLT